MSYRHFLYSDLRSHNFAFDFVGLCADGLADPEHSGFSGYRIRRPDLSPRQLWGEIATSSIALEPDIILLHAGTNDVKFTRNVATEAADFADLVDFLLSASPNVRIVVSPLSGVVTAAANEHRRWDEFNRLIHEIVREKKKNGARVQWAGEMENCLSPTDMTDSIHPNNSGYQKMAAVWLSYILDENKHGVAVPGAYDLQSQQGRKDFETHFYLNNANGLAYDSISNRLVYVWGIKKGKKTFETDNHILFDPDNLDSRNIENGTIAAEFSFLLPAASLSLFSRAQGNGISVSRSRNSEITPGYELVLYAAARKLKILKAGVVMTEVDVPTLALETTYRLTLTTETVGSSVAAAGLLSQNGEAIASTLFTDAISPVLEGQLGVRFSTPKTRGAYLGLNRVEIIQE